MSVVLLVTAAAMTLPATAFATPPASRAESEAARATSDSPARERITAADCPAPAAPDTDYLCPVGPTYLVPALTDITGWDEPAHYRNILTGDLDGDGVDELVARGTGGTQVFHFVPSLGQWSQVLVDPILPDHDGWDQPQYYETLRLGDVDGDGRDELVARSGVGVIVYRYTQGGSPDAATWTQLTTSGPMPDVDGWNADPSYYSTIQLVPLGRQGASPTMQLLGRGRDGLHLWRWSGSGWTLLATATDLSDANGWTQPGHYSTITAWDESTLLARSAGGLVVYRYAVTPTGPGSWTQLCQSSPASPLAPDADGWNQPQYYSTIQPLRGHRPAADPFIALRGGGGMQAIWFTVSGSCFSAAILSRFSGPLPDSQGWDKADRYLTIQAADVDGDGKDEIIGRGSSGMVAHRLDAQAGTWSSALGAGTPALADEPWATDPSYYGTIATADLDAPGPPARGRSLLARGEHGLRTWRWTPASSSWARYRPYGAFPQVDAAALAAVTAYLGIARGTIRDVYTDPSRDSTSDQLQAFQNDIAQTCSGPVSASPPRYTSCQPPPSAPGVSPAAWTAVSNQILAELFWARQVVDHFTTLNDVQTALFLDEDAEFPSLAADLRLAQASGAVQPQGANTAEIFEGVFELMGTLTALIPGGEPFAVAFEITAASLGIAVAATPEASDEHGPSELDHSFADVQKTIATIRQQTQDAIQAHRRYVSGDYGLLSTVGHLVSAQVWTLDRQAAVSAGRQRFTGWLYEQFLPVLWDHWHVTKCGSDYGCPLPPQGPLMRWYPDPNFPDPTRVTDIDGVLPKQLPCHAEFLNAIAVCHWATFDEQGYGPSVNTLIGAVSLACTYDPRAGTSWRYGSCSLGVPVVKVLSGSAPWTFNQVSCDFSLPTPIFQPLGFDCINPHVSVPATPSRAVGRVTGVGTRDATVTMSLEHPVTGRIDLRGAKVRVRQLLHEATADAADELLAHRNGQDVLPRVVPVAASATRHAAAFRSSIGAFRLRGTLSVDEGMLQVDIRLHGASLDAPQGCSRQSRTSHLGHHLIVIDGNARLIQSLALLPWHCATERDGSIGLYYPAAPPSRRVPTE